MPHALLAAAADPQNTGWGTKAPIIPHPGELVFGIIAIVIIYVVVARKVVPRLEEMYAERRAAIEGQIEQADKAQAEAQEALEQYRKQLADSREEASRIREEARAEGAQILAELRTRAQAEANRLVEQAHAQITAERQQALVTLRAEVGGIATELASKVVGESLEDEARQRRVVERFLADLEAGDVDVARAEPATTTSGGTGTTTGEDA